MNTTTALALVFLLFFFSVEAGAQGSRRRARHPAAANPAAARPAPQPTTEIAAPVASASSAPIPLATVNGESITTADIDPKVRQEIESLEVRIAEARRQVLELQINTLLLESEAAKRKVSPQELYNLEILRKIPEPTAAEIDQFIQTNHEQLSEADPATIRDQVINYLKGEREAQTTDAFLKRARLSNPVVNVATANGAGLPPGAVILTVAGHPITAGMIDERLKPIIFKLRLNTYQLSHQALDVTINDLLLVAEAKRRNVPPEEIVRKEITEKIHAPTEAEIAKFYTENKKRIPGEFAAASNQIASYLQERERQQLETDLSKRLRSGANVRVLISEPALPVQLISVDDDPVRGDAKAPVTIVEFTDFQCPSCAALQPILEEVLKAYGDKVRLVVRDFPLTMHANARKAAEAADAANAQGKFFEYAALLFKR